MSALVNNIAMFSICFAAGLAGVLITDLILGYWRNAIRQRRGLKKSFEENERRS